jgi:pimeloyl-ACP methyl ester carboxylesterase
VHNAIPGSHWVLFDQSAHMAHIEEPARYLQVLDDFLTQNEVPA